MKYVCDDVCVMKEDSERRFEGEKREEFIR